MKYNCQPKNKISKKLTKTTVYDIYDQTKYSYIGEIVKIKEYLQKYGHKSRWFAGKLGIAASTLSNYSNGKFVPPLSMRILIEQMTNKEVSREEWDLKPRYKKKEKNHEGES